MRSADLQVKNTVLDFGTVKIPYELRRGKPGEIRIGFGDRHVWIETNRNTLGPKELEFIEEKGEWLQRHYTRLRHAEALRAAFQKNADKEARLFGKPTPVQFWRGSKLYFKYDKGLLNIHVTDKYVAHPRACIAGVLQQLAKHYLVRRTRELAEYCNIDVKDIRIKTHQTKWGSCSSNRNINLNWYLILLDKALIDYVIVHELMHLHEMNHGPKFWKWVAKYIPHYKDLIVRLRQSEWVIGSYES